MESEAKETRPAASDDEHETSRASEAKAAAYDERDAAPENVAPSSSPAFGEEQRAPAAPLALERARLVAQQGLHAHAEALRSIDPGLLARYPELAEAKEQLDPAAVGLAVEAARFAYRRCRRCGFKSVREDDFARLAHAVEAANPFVCVLCSDAAPAARHDRGPNRAARARHRRPSAGWREPPWTPRQARKALARMLVRAERDDEAKGGGDDDDGAAARRRRAASDESDSDARDPRAARRRNRRARARAADDRVESARRAAIREAPGKLEAALASAQRARAQQNAALAMRLENRPLASDRARARRFDADMQGAIATAERKARRFARSDSESDSDRSRHRAAAAARESKLAASSEEDRDAK